MKQPIKITLATFDLAKGIAVLGIILGHMLANYDVDKVILLPFTAPFFLIKNAINPMFFIASGFALRPQPARKMLKRTARELVKPYLIVTALVCLLFPLVHFSFFRWWPGAFQETLRYALAFLLGTPKSGAVVLGVSLYECSVMWFFLTLFLSLNLMNLILKLKNQTAQFLTVFACACLGFWGLVQGFPFFCLPQGLLALGYCYVGYLARDFGIFTDQKSHFWLYLALVLVTALQLPYARFSISHGYHRFGMLDYLGSCCSGLLFLAVCVRINQQESRGLDWLRQIGVYSYWIMCIHSVEMVCIPWYTLSRAMPEHPLCALVIELLIKSAIIGAGCYILKTISKQIYKRRRNRLGR